MQLLTGWLILLLSVMGHTELWVVAVNRLHAMHIQAALLRKFRTLHDVAVLGYPFGLLWFAGFSETSLLRGGRPVEQSRSLLWLLLVTMTGCIPLLCGIIRWQFIRRPQFLQQDVGERIDVESATRSDPASNDIRGPRRHPSQLWPLNEVYWLDVNTKSVRTTRANGTAPDRPLRIVHFSDLHLIGCPGGDYYRFMIRKAEAFNADVYVFTGDLIDRVELLPTAVEILSPLTKLAPCYFVLGNHDWRFDHSQIREQLEASGWKCVAGTADIVTLRGRRVLFAGSELPWMGKAPPAIGVSKCDLNVLISHSPDQHPFAGRSGYDLMLAGHTHGGQVVLPLVGPVYSPSLFGVSFVSGLFRMGPLTVHVTRGVGAKDPLRWNCCPELTCLEVYC